MIRVFATHITEDDRRAVDDVLRSGFIGPGEKVAEFETALCDATGKTHAVCCNSGTTALMLAIRERRSWDKHAVFSVPAYGMRAAAHVIRLLGDWHETHDAGVEPFEAVHISINHNGHPGSPCDIEDARQSIGIPGAFYAETCCLSFAPSKLVCTGQGGCVLTDSSGIANYIRQDVDPHRNADAHGNFRMSDIQAALGISQLKRLDELTARRNRLHDMYRERLDNLNCGWCVIYRSQDADGFIKHLASKGIEALQPYRDSVVPGFPNAERAAKEEVFLPGHLNLTEREVNYVCEAVRGFENGV